MNKWEEAINHYETTYCAGCNNDQFCNECVIMTTLEALYKVSNSSKTELLGDNNKVRLLYCGSYCGARDTCDWKNIGNGFCLEANAFSRGVKYSV